jgi:hypothetical protein
MNDLLAFFTPEHHAVRNFAVRELPRAQGSPLRASVIPVPRVVELLDDLEKRLFFLVRNAKGEVTWAFPVTCERTPHRLLFSTGEQIYGA